MRKSTFTVTLAAGTNLPTPGSQEEGFDIPEGPPLPGDDVA